VYKIKTTPKYGRGCFATKHVSKGSVVADCEIILLNPQDTEIIDKTVLKYYNFNYDKHRNCLVLADGMIFNHSDEPNLSYGLIRRNGRDMMRFRAKRCIDRGEQLFIDYSSDEDVDLEEYFKAG
jgi:SET domain-containing protein